MGEQEECVPPLRAFSSRTVKEQRVLGWADLAGLIFKMRFKEKLELLSKSCRHLKKVFQTEGITLVKVLMPNVLCLSSRNRKEASVAGEGQREGESIEN